MEDEKATVSLPRFYESHPSTQQSLGLFPES